VATLIARGRSNREIAETLVISYRIVETHIANIMFKLDCTSRSQVAAWVVEKGYLTVAKFIHLLYTITIFFNLLMSS